MSLRILVLASALSQAAHVTLAQSPEQRLGMLEARVSELCQFHYRDRRPHGFVPADVVGNEHLRWGFPGGDCDVLLGDYFITCHDRSNRIPQWVTYRLDSVSVAGEAERTDDFRADPYLPDYQRAELRDYEASGYDRGHMAPAAAFRRSEAAMSETFKLSNMAPQTPALNRQMWRMLEEDIRELALRAASIWAYTGSLFLDENGSITEPTIFIGENRVAVPTHFYKVMLAETAACGPTPTPPSYTAPQSSRLLMFGFVMRNQTDPLEGEAGDYAVSVDLVETLTRLDFFSALPDSLEDVLEETAAEYWPLPIGTTR